MSNTLAIMGFVIIVISLLGLSMATTWWRQRLRSSRVSRVDPERCLQVLGEVEYRTVQWVKSEMERIYKIRLSEKDVGFCLTSLAEQGLVEEELYPVQRRAPSPNRVRRFRKKSGGGQDVFALTPPDPSNRLVRVS